MWRDTQVGLLPKNRKLSQPPHLMIFFGFGFRYTFSTVITYWLTYLLCTGNSISADWCVNGCCDILIQLVSVKWYQHFSIIIIRPFLIGCSINVFFIFLQWKKINSTVVHNEIIMQKIWLQNGMTYLKNNRASWEPYFLLFNPGVHFWQWEGQHKVVVTS